MLLSTIKGTSPVRSTSNGVRRLRAAELPRDRMVVMYCNSGALSAQAAFALRLLEHDNVKVLQDGIEGWKAKGGFDANQRSLGKAKS